MIRCGKQQVINRFGIDIRHLIDQMIQRKDDLKMGYGQQPRFLVRQPLRFGERPTLGTMTVTTRAIANLEFPTLVTLTKKATGGGCSTLDNRVDGGKLLRRAVILLELVAKMQAKDVSNFHCRFDRRHTQERGKHHAASLHQPLCSCSR